MARRVNAWPVVSMHGPSCQCMARRVHVRTADRLRGSVSLQASNNITVTRCVFQGTERCPPAQALSLLIGLPGAMQTVR